MHEWPLANPLTLERKLMPICSLDILGNNSIFRADYMLVQNYKINVAYMLVFAIRTKNICEQFERFLSDNSSDIEKLTKADEKYMSGSYLDVPKEEEPELLALIDKCPRITLRCEDLVAYRVEGFSFTGFEIDYIERNHYPMDDYIRDDHVYIGTKELPKGVHYLMQAFEASRDPMKWAQWARHRREKLVLSVDQVKRQFFIKSIDAEVESLDIILSLKCPISLQRLERPVRGANCRHLACFDEKSFDLMTSNNGDKEKLTKCPLCSEILSDMVVCGYTLDMLCTSGNNEVIIDAELPQ